MGIDSYKIVEQQKTTVEAIKSADEIRKLAENASDDDWDIIDEALGRIEGDEKAKLVEWANDHILDDNYNWSDLAATVLGLDGVKIGTVIDNLYQSLKRNNGDFEFASFRAACALAKEFENLDDEVKELVIERLEEFKDDEDLGEIAEVYLNKINNLN